MPQEERTASMLERAGAGIMIKRANEVVPAVAAIATDQNRVLAYRASAKSLGVPDATQRIIREIDGLMPASAGALGN
jgi:UDP-N-acetylglucosamine:LPS N-acetylglucosamine transferase